MVQSACNTFVTPFLIEFRNKQVDISEADEHDNMKEDDCYMKKTILAFALAILVLTGCSVNKTQQSTVSEPTQKATESTAELGALITVPAATPTTASTVPPVKETVPPATTAPAAPAAIVITKHPSSETVSAGGGTWFIAGAENDTQITWEFFSPDGTMYSLQQAMSAHPDLILEVLPEDTLGLRQIPASFSGWSARARYDGPGGTAVTERATITVRDPYGEIIELYRDVHRAGKGNMEKGVSELVNNYDFLGYAIEDLDGNGVAELILATDSHSDYPYVIYEVYTLQNGTAVSVTQSRARARYYMLQDGRFLMEGSNSATSASWITYGFGGASLWVQEQIWTSEEPHDLADFAPYYYYSPMAYAEGEPMVYDEAARIIESWEWSLNLPAMIPIN